MCDIRSVFRTSLVALAGLSLACTASPIAPDRTPVAPGAGQLAKRPPADGPDLVARCQTCFYDDIYSNFTGRVLTENLGTETAPSSKTRVYLSLDRQLDHGDELILTVDVPALPPGDVHDHFIGLLAHDQPPRMFYLLTVADAGGAAAETNERNNFIAQKSVLR